MNSQKGSLAIYLSLMALGCSRPDSGTASLIASQTIGPAGGVLVVDSGSQDGLLMTVSPSVLEEAVEFRVFDLPLDLGGECIFEPVASRFRIEPRDLVLSENVTLRMPYSGTRPSVAPGNVAICQISPYAERTYDPVQIDVGNRWVEIGIKTFGEFQVVEGALVSSLLDYAPAIGEVAVLSDGFTFAVEEEPQASPFVPQGAQQWRLTGPGFDESLIFMEGAIVGRRSGPSTWLELWSEAYSPYQNVEVGSVFPQPLVMQFQAPVGSLGLGASIIPLGYYQFVEPIIFDGQLLLDIMRLSVDAVYDRGPLGMGQRQMTYLLSPSVGLISVMVDGVVYDRIP